MLKRLKNIFFGKSGTVAEQEPLVIPPSKHGLSPESISKGARNVVEVLEGAGFQAFLVGGCVRDLLLGHHPKDFDVATNATPEQVKLLFRRSRIIGRRFRIVHVHMGREMVEVTTFRAHHDSESGSHTDGVKTAQGLLLRDNVFGDIGEDASRRDFTVNALYYHPTDNTIYDYASGFEHIQERKLRILGVPETRFREDPVRLLRAVRFAAKLNFELEQQTEEYIRPHGHLLAEVPPARLFDEFLKLFLSGHALKTFQLLQHYQLLGYLFPETDSQLKYDEGFYRRFIEQALINTDHRIITNMRVTPAFLLAALLWPAVKELSRKLEREGTAPIHALNQAAAMVSARQVERIALPRRYSQPMKEIWDLQLRLGRRSGNRALQLLEHPRFRAGYDFVLLREQAGEDLAGLGQWWTRFQEANPELQSQMMTSVQDSRKRPKRRRRSGRSRKSSGSGSAQTDIAPSSATDND